MSPRRTLDQVIGFEYGAGQHGIDALPRRRWRLQVSSTRSDGECDPGTVREALRPLAGRSIFPQTPAKTTGREHLESSSHGRCADPVAGCSDSRLIATATALTAHSIAAAYRDSSRPRGRFMM